MLTDLIKKYWPALTITIVVFAFFSKLFFPPSLFVTPDYGRSDSWHLSIANKFYYAHEIKKNTVPIWNPKIGTGYPTLAEGQTAIFFPINLVIFRLLPFVYAYNLTLVASIVTAAIGTYFFCRSHKLSKLASTYAGIIFSLGGFFVFHVQHHNLIQTASLLPWLFWALSEFINTKKLLFLLFLSLFTAFQLFAGFPQIVFYTYVGLSIYTILIIHGNKKIPKFKMLGLITAAVTFGFLLAAIQIVPTYEFLANSTRQSNPKSVLLEFPYKTKNLMQFIDPFILGSPKDGTYPVWQPQKWGIFWESIGYIGTIPLILSLAIILGNLFKKIKNLNVTIFSIVAFMSILLALGVESPLHVVFSIPPFSIFRVPSRFLLLVSFSLAVLSASYLEKFKKQKLVILPLVFFSLLNIFVVGKNYNPILEARKLLEQPQTAKIINENAGGRTYTAGNSIIWNENFLKGWDNIENFYFLRNYLDQNSNLIFNVNQFSAYESMQTKRASYLGAFMRKETKLKDKTVEFTNKAISTLAANNVAYIISPYEIKNQDTIEKLFQKAQKNNNAFVYKIKNQGKLFMLTKNISIATSSQQVIDTLNQEDFDALKKPIIETSADFKLPSEDLKYSIFNQSSNTSKHELETQTNTPSFLIFNQSYYPGWQATINGKKTEIYPANVNSMAIFVPQGKNTIELRYKSATLYSALVLSLISFAFLILIFLKMKHVTFK